MAEQKQVTEPAAPVVLAKVTEPRTYDATKRVTAYDTVSGEKLPYPVPETHLDGRFPNLTETPKEGK